MPLSVVYRHSASYGFLYLSVGKLRPSYCGSAVFDSQNAAIFLGLLLGEGIFSVAKVLVQLVWNIEVYSFFPLSVCYGSANSFRK